MIYIQTTVVDAIIHERFSFVHTCVLMGYLDGKSYCLVGKVFPFSCRCNKYECHESKV